MRSQPENILIVLLGAIGDVVRGLPLAVRIKQHWPDCKLTWAVEPRSRDLVEGHLAIDQIVLFDRPRGFPAYIEFISRLRAQKFDVVLDLQRHFKSGFTSFCTRGSRRIGFNPANTKEFNWLFNTEYISPVENFSHKIMHYQLFGDALGLPAMKPLEFELVPAQDDLEKVRELLSQASEEVPPTNKRIALILGSTWESRFWTVDGYQELISKLNERLGVVSYLVGGSSEEMFAKEVMFRSSNKAVINLTGKTRLRELTALFSAMCCAIGSDSGPMHIAAAVGTPMVSLWGATSPKRSAPYAFEHLVVDAQVECSPCYKRKCSRGDLLCMQKITAEMILEKVQLL